MIFIVTLLLFAFVLPIDGIAVAEGYRWQTGYEDYLDTLDDNDRDWYFGDDYLDVDGALSIIGGFLADDNFDKQALKDDPIIIAVVDSGIGYAYTTDGETETEPYAPFIYDEGVEYKLHPIFEDVLLTDEEGNYVYKNVVDELKIKERNNTNQVIETFTNIPQNEGNIALDMVDNTSDNHGTHVTGIIAMLIHKFGLEDYIKILPIKANTVLFYNEEKGSFTAGYNIEYLNMAMDFCLENQVDIVSLSLTAYNQSEDSGYRFADYVDDMLIVAASGNDGSSSKKGYPAYADNVLGVMNCTRDEEGNAILANSSNYGQTISGKQYYDIATPGTGIISSINGEEYGKLTGTSMSTPITAFATALGYFRYRGYNNYNYGYTLNPLSVSTMISHGVDQMATKKDGLFTYKYPMLTLTHILTYDFYNDAEFLEKIGEIQEESPVIEYIDIIEIADPQYKIGSNETLVLIANPVPANATKDATLTWFLLHDGETIIGEGWTIEWTIPDAVGTYTIYCGILDEDGNLSYVSRNTIMFDVVYRTPDELEIVHNNTEYAVGKTYTFTIPTQFVNPDIALDIEWYVNGVKMGEGEVFNFTPDELGDYTITVKVNGKKIDEITITSYTENGWMILMATVVMLASSFIGVKSLWVIIIVKTAIDIAGGISILIIYGIRKRNANKIDN